MNKNENNKKLALFMGAIVLETYLNEKKETDHYLVDYGLSNKGNWPNYSRYHATSTMKYDSSWDWVMPLVRQMKMTELLKEALLEQDIKKVYNACLSQLS